MPPPKRPKSDVRWTTLCAEANGTCDVSERDTCCDVAVVCRSSSVSAHHLDASVATSPSASLPASADACLDGRRRRRADSDEGPTSGTSSSSSCLTSLRRLLLEPVTTMSTSSVPAAHVVELATAARLGCNLPATSSSRSPAARPSAALRRILLNENSRQHHPRPPVAGRSVVDSAGSQNRFAGGGGDVDGSLDSATSASVAGAPPQSSAGSCDCRKASSPSSSHTQSTSRVESRDSRTTDDLVSRSSAEHQRAVHASLK